MDEAQLDLLEAVVHEYSEGRLSVHAAAQRILELGFTESFAIGADSQETFDSPAFRPFHDLLDEVLRLQDLRRPA
jgi:hypothetical protein